MRFMNSGVNLRRKACFHCRPLNLVIEVVVDFHRFRRETKPAIHQIRHLTGPQVRGQDDDALRQIDAAIIAKRQRGLIQNAEQQLPQRVTGLLNFVKQQNGELQFLREPFRFKNFLRVVSGGWDLANKVSRRRNRSASQFRANAGTRRSRS